MLTPFERPRLRPGLALAADEHDSRFVFLYDPIRVSSRPQRLTVAESDWLSLLDGRRTLRDIQGEAIRQTGGQMLQLESLLALVEKLDDGLYLEGGKFRQLLDNPVREPSCIGCYDEEPAALRRQLRALFTRPDGPGLPRQAVPDGRLRAALVPHIDYQRGGATYAWGFKEVIERTDASLFVIIGTSHYSPHRFTLTRKHFKTPLGIVPTDQDYIDRLVVHHGDGLFDDEVAHLPEHSIELEVVLLQYLCEDRRPFRIVPLVVGSFGDAVALNQPPTRIASVARMIGALRQAEAETAEPICYLISGDLAHIGPKFGDPDPVHPRRLELCRRQDQKLIQAAERVDPAGYFDVIAREDDCRRICGLPPTYTLLEAIQPRKGKLLHYGQYVHPHGFESVSFASVAFYR